MNRERSHMVNIVQIANNKEQKHVDMTHVDKEPLLHSLIIDFRNQCVETVNHEKDGIQHRCGDKCKYQDQYDNRVYLCKVSQAPG